MTTIALFGTSADPPTAGHQAILCWLSQQYDWVAVWASDNPFKQHQTNLKHRMRMLALLIREINPARHNIQVREELSHRRSLVSVGKAKEIWGEDADYTLIIGSDLVGQIRHWYRIEELLREVSILVIPRFGYLIKDDDIAAIQSLGGKCEIADLTAPGVSSTDYRVHHDDTVVTQPIQEYIHQEKLYV